MFVCFGCAKISLRVCFMFSRRTCKIVETLSPLYIHYIYVIYIIVVALYIYNVVKTGVE